MMHLLNQSRLNLTINGKQSGPLHRFGYGRGTFLEQEQNILSRKRSNKHLGNMVLF